MAGYWQQGTAGTEGKLHHDMNVTIVVQHIADTNSLFFLDPGNSYTGNFI